MSGIADAVACDANDHIGAVIDWKSDVEFDADKLALYRTQLSDYRKQTATAQALLVLVTRGQIPNPEYYWSSISREELR